MMELSCIRYPYIARDPRTVSVSLVVLSTRFHQERSIPSGFTQVGHSDRATVYGYGP